MKVEVQTEKKFNPVTLEITFESQEEIDMFSSMLGFNVRIPDLVYDPDVYPKDNQKLQNLMDKIRDNLP